MPSAISEPPKPPTPAPNPTPTPSPAPTPAPSPEPKPSGVSSEQAFEDKFAHLDEAPIIPAKAEPAPAPTPAAPKPGTPAAPTPKPEVKKDDAEPAPENYEPPQVAKPNELRAFAKRMGDMAKNSTKENKTLRARVAELEARPPQTVDNGNSKLLNEQLAAANKQIEEYENELRVTRYERSKEYKNEHERPYNDALKRAYRDVGELLVTDRKANPDDPDRPIETERQATKEDFNEIYGLPLGAAQKIAKAKFGDQWPLVLDHVKSVREKAEAAFQAIEDHRAKGADQEKQKEVQTQQERAFAQSAWGKSIESMKAKAPEAFDVRPDDPEGNKLLAEGMEFADLAFDDSLEKYSLPQQIMIQARVRTWAGAYPRLRRDVAALKAQLDEANATIAQLRGSEPGKPAPSGETTPAAPSNVLDAFDKMLPG